MRFRHVLGFIVLVISCTALFINSVYGQHGRPITMFEYPFAFGLTMGTATGIHVSITASIDNGSGIRVGADYGAGIAQWGIANMYDVQLGVVTKLSDDNMNDALMLNPALAYGVMMGGPSTGWLRFSPYKDVAQTAVECTAMWIHLYDRMGLEFGVTAGLMYALEGIDKNGEDVTGSIAPRFRIYSAVIF